MIVQKKTLLERANSLVEKKSSLIAALAVTSLATATTANADIIMFNDGSLQTDIPGFGGPLETFGGTNGTSEVTLAGSAGGDSTGSQTSGVISFENTGVVDLSAGQSILVNYDFDQVFQTSSGGAADISFELTLFIDEDGANVSVGDSGSDSFGFTPGGDVTLDWSGSFQTTPFASNLTGEDLRFVLTGTFDVDGQGGFLSSASIVVPQSSITFTIVPEPGMGILLGCAVLWAGALHRFRRRKERRS